VKLALAAVIAAVGCGRSEPAQPAPDPYLALPQPTSNARRTIPIQTRELITAVIDDWTSTRATLRRYRRDHGRWTLVGAAWPGVIGKAGAGWGDGLHGNGAAPGLDGPVKHEGDGKSPAGAFTIGGSYGYADAPPTGARLPYHAVTPAWKCVDDPASRHYNEILDQTRVDVDWKSAEDMRRDDEVYTWVVDVGHNAKHVPGKGSCIFLHVWRGPDSSTVGCTAMAEPVLAQLIATLDPSAVFVLLPKHEYAVLAEHWDLPEP